MNRDPRVAFLTGLIDDAGLFPPASLPMEEAVAAHRESLAGTNGWILARFICPASRLSDLDRWLPDEAVPWGVSVILDGAAGDRWLDEAVVDLSATRRFAEIRKGSARVELLEVPLPQDIDAPLLHKFVDAVEDAGLPDPVIPFLEVPRAAPVPATLEIIAEMHDRLDQRGACRRPGAKLRCGGASEEIFPTPARVASFIHWCNRLGLPLKATAGLHHPFRHTDPETGFVQHGFVNVVGAAVLASAHDLDAEAIADIVSDQDPASFSLAPEGFTWKDFSASEPEIGTARGRLFRSYGSCSFVEPVEDLTGLGILPLP
jgi:hypothetical protein